MIDPIVPESFDYRNILTNDFMYPAWDITNKKPVFFSTVVAEKEIKKDPNTLYSMNFNNMILASATNPTYFTSSQIDYGNKGDNAIFFGGNTVASSPALYSHFLTSHFKNITTSKIQIVSIGSVDYAADKLTSSVGIVGWA